MTEESLYDLLIIGGGINGTGIALDAAGRDLKVMLCEADDLASGTSSASTKLIHGGLRYLEQGHLLFVRESLLEREILLKKAPHIIRPLRFIMPYSKSMRPAWLIRIGLFLYDHLGGRKILPKSQSVNLRQIPAGQILKNTFTKGFSYFDCWADDSRLVAINAISAAQLGAKILTRTKVITATREIDHWIITIADQRSGSVRQIKSKVLINAAGPWGDIVLRDELHLSNTQHITLVKGSHIIVPRIGTHDEAMILQNTDQRIVFLIPYLEHFTLIGTTDENFTGDPGKAEISPDEIHYLCAAVNHFLHTSIKPNTILHSYAGVRALVSSREKNPATISRDYRLQLDEEDGKCPLLSVFGGKLTTHRQLAEHALLKLKPYFSHLKPAWTSKAILSGGDIADADMKSFITQVLRQYYQLDVQLIKRYAQLYGTRIHLLLENINSTADLGKHYGSSLYHREVVYLIQYEFALTAADILWRRTKLGYFFPNENLNELIIAIKNLTPT